MPVRVDDGRWQVTDPRGDVGDAAPVAAVFGGCEVGRDVGVAVVVERPAVAEVDADLAAQLLPGVDPPAAA